MSKCLECGYYDKEKHYCPFYCQLIRETLNEAISFELEKIKAEMCEPNEMEYFENSNVWQKWFWDLIDRHISELKEK